MVTAAFQNPYLLIFDIRFKFVKVVKINYNE
jgi:hypothetical protein